MSTAACIWDRDILITVLHIVHNFSCVWDYFDVL